MPGVTMKELAEITGGELVGDPSLSIRRVRPPADAEEGDIAVVLERSHLEAGQRSAATALVVSQDWQIEAHNLIRVENARRALAQIIHRLHPKRRPRPGIEAGALVHTDAEIGENAFIAAGARVEAGVVLGDRVEIHANTVVGEAAQVGSETVLYPNVTIYPNMQIGSRVQVHSGTVIGAPGFSQRHGDDGRCEGMPQVGTVEIGDDVEIGACCTIDRSTLGTTRIGRGTKIDNQVQIGHNCDIGEDCIIIAQVGISGSVRIGDRCTLAGQVGVSDHVTLEPETVVAAKAGVIRDLETGVWIGYPAMPAVRARRVYNHLGALPEMSGQLRRALQRCDDLEQQLDQLRLDAHSEPPESTTRDSEGA